MKKTYVLLAALFTFLFVVVVFAINNDENTTTEKVEKKHPHGYQIGDKVENFRLKNIDNNFIGLNNYKNEQGVIVIFTCNHCPFSVKYEDRIIELQNQFGDLGYPVIAINPNDPIQYPSDSFEAMKERSREKRFNFPYLFDDTQNIAKAFGAKKTPHTFLLQNIDNEFVVKYIGAIDDDTKGNDIEVKFVEYAVNSLMNGQNPNPETTKAIGCSIKWR